MFLVETHHFPIAKSQSFGDTLNRVLDALTDLGVSNTRARIYCDELASAKRSAVAAAIKKIPALAALRVPADNSEVQWLTNLDATWDRHLAPSVNATVALEDLCTLATGIPRPFNFQHVHVHLAPIPPLALTGHVPEPGQTREIDFWEARLDPGIYLVDSWRNSGRQVVLQAVVHRPTPDAAASKLPPLPSNTRHVLAAFGKAQRIQTRVWLEGDEAQPIHELDRQARRLKALRPVVPEQVSAAESSHAGSLKAAVLHALSPLGYRYRTEISSRGNGWLAKRTERKHHLYVHYDWAPRNKQVFAELFVRGALFCWHAELPVASPKRGGAKVASPDAVTAVANNLRVAVAALEASWVPAIEEIYGDGYAWFDPNDEPSLLPLDLKW